MTRRRPNPPDLIEQPQLAAVMILESALEIAELVLLSAYPDHWGEESTRCRRSEEDAYVDSIFHQIHALEGTLQHYRRSVERRPRLGPSREDEAPPF